MTDVCVCVCVQSREGVGRRHQRSVSQRGPLRSAQAGGGTAAHQELEVHTHHQHTGAHACVHMSLKHTNTPIQFRNHHLQGSRGAVKTLKSLKFESPDFKAIKTS